VVGLALKAICKIWLKPASTPAIPSVKTDGNQKKTPVFAVGFNQRLNYKSGIGFSQNSPPSDNLIRILDSQPVRL
jgi:hypothetical protein